MQPQPEADVRLHHVPDYYLAKIGQKLNVHFTIEYLAGSDTFGRTDEALDLDLATVEELIDELEKKMPDIRVVLDRSDKDFPVLHLIDKQLGKKSEVLDRKIDLKYSGSVGELYKKLATKISEIDPRLSGWSWEAFNDYRTNVDIDVKQTPIRAILTHCVDLEEYRPLIWTAKTRQTDGEWKTQIRFTGPKPIGPAAP